MKYLTTTPQWAAIVLSAFLLTPAQAATISVPTDHSTIQAAIDASTNGDVINVSPGTYKELIDFKGKAITLKSTDGAETTIIDGDKQGTVVSLKTSETIASVLDGFTVTNGSSSLNAGGIYINNASATIKNNIIKNNFGGGSGNGIAAHFSAAIINNNVIESNNNEGSSSGGGGGGGVFIGGAGTVTLSNNTIRNNTTDKFIWGGGVLCYAAGTPSIINNIIENNSAELGAGISLVNAQSALISQNIIKGNQAKLKGGGIYFSTPSGDRGPYIYSNLIIKNVVSGGGTVGNQIYSTGYTATAKITNNIIVNNSSIDAVYCANESSSNQTPIINNNNVYSTGGGDQYNGPNCTMNSHAGLYGNISSSPLFINESNKNYQLKSGDLSIDAGDNASNTETLDMVGFTRVVDGNNDGGAVIDMGPLENGKNSAPEITNPSSAFATPGQSINLPAVTIVDNAAADDILSLSITISSGTFSLNSSTGMSISTGSATDTSNLVATAKLSDINNALSNMSVTASDQEATLTIEVDDQGTSGTGGAMKSSKTITIKILAQIDPATPAPGTPGAGTSSNAISSGQFSKNSGGSINFAFLISLFFGFLFTTIKKRS